MASLTDSLSLSVGHFAVVALLALLFRFLLYPLFLSPLARIPSAHWSSPISPFWILHARFKRQENGLLLAAHRRLGPVVRVAPNELSIDDMDSVRTVYGGGFEKTKWYSVFDNYGVPCMFSSRPGPDHSLRKRMVSNVYSKTHVQSSEASKTQARAILFDRLLPTLTASASDSQAPQGIDVHSLFLSATMDFISAYVYGLQNSTNFIQETAYREHWLQLYMSRHDYGFFPQELPLLTKLLRTLGVSPYPRWVDAANREMELWNQRHCKTSLESNSSAGGQLEAAENDPVVLKALLAGLQKEDVAKAKGPAVDPSDVQHFDLTVNSELFDHVLAGQETAGVTLTYLTWQLSKDPALQRTLRTELLSLEPNMQVLGSSSGLVPDPKALDNLPTLHAILMETLRLHTALPGSLPRETPKSSCQIGPYRVPGRVRIAALAYTLHRDETIFPDPEKFDHTRWLVDGVDEESRKQRNRQFWAFSSGGRMCIGSNFAMQEMKRIIAAIYSNFTTHIVDDEGMKQIGGYARPESERLYLRFEAVG